MRRFYRQALAVACEAGWRVELDGRPVRTPLRHPQVVPALPLALALAEEWNGQGEEITPASFFHRDLADYAIDVVRADRAPVIAALLGYAETDTLCYRADPDEPFCASQRAMWEPLLQAAEQRLGVRFARVSGVMHRPQPEATLQALRQVVEAKDNFTLAALTTLASLAASLVLALAALEPDADAAILWNAANLEEDWQAEHWGRDQMALERRENRLRDFTRAMEFAALIREQG